MPVDRLLTNIATADVGRSKEFYIRLLAMHVHFDSDWFVILKPSATSPLELGLVDRDHEVVPARGNGPATGTYLTFVVDDALATLEIARDMAAEIIEGPTDMFYGQRRILVRDPDGVVLDISSLIPA